MNGKTRSMIAAEAGRKGGRARARKYCHRQLSDWAKLGGWPKGRPRKPQAQAANVGGEMSILAFRQERV